MGGKFGVKKGTQGGKDSEYPHGLNLYANAKVYLQRKLV